MHHLTIPEIYTKFNTSAKGLTTAEASKRSAENRNELKEKEKTSLFELVKQQFEDTLVLILLASAFVSFLLSVYEGFNVEPFVILTILIVNAIVAIKQETNAEEAIEALSQYYADECSVMRDGKQVKIPSKDLALGDVVLLSVGDKVPADCRVIKIISSEFKADQSILTGEPVSVSKQIEPISDENAVLQEQHNIVFSGTAITVGKAHAVVVKVGAETAIGVIHEEISNTEDEKTPLKVQLDEFGDDLAKVITVICILVWVININHFNDPAHGGYIKGAIYYFKIAVALAVAAIPEGLAVIITTCLALGTKQMAKEGAIVRKLKSVETLGCCSVICSDKTGTLTTNQMSVRKILYYGKSEEILEVTGNTYGPEGELILNGKKVPGHAVSVDSLAEIVKISSICNESSVTYNPAVDQFQRLGEPTEAALYSLVEKVGTHDPVFNQSVKFLGDSSALEKLTVEQKKNRCSKVNEFYDRYEKKFVLEFNRDRKSMSTIASFNGEDVLYCKGAPESVVARSNNIMINGKEVPFTAEMKKGILKQSEIWGGNEALRVLGFAIKKNIKLPGKLKSSDFIKIESEMCFVGLVAMMDPPRPEVKDAIEKCKIAGIRVVVITGDHQKTAESVCRQIGLMGAESDGLSFTGKEFDNMSTEEKRKAVEKAIVFSRTEPIHKSQLVDLYKQAGYIVAMTGDGVNDAPALKKADIGVSMGTGTDVAKMASDMVLQDDNFSTIVSAVKQGRQIYANTKQFIRYLISSNIGEVISIFLTVVLGMPEALVPVQLLWVNLVTDGLPATALGFNPPDSNIMRQKPRKSDEKLVSNWLLFRYCVIGIYVGCATVFGYAWWFLYYTGGPMMTFPQLQQFYNCTNTSFGCEIYGGANARSAATMSLSVLVVVEMANAMNSLSETESLLTFPLWKNIYLVGAIVLSLLLHFIILYVPLCATIFGVEPLGYEEWYAVLWMSLPVLLVDEVLKIFARFQLAGNAASRKQKIE